MKKLFLLVLLLLLPLVQAKTEHIVYLGGVSMYPIFSEQLVYVTATFQDELVLGNVYCYWDIDDWDPDFDYLCHQLNHTYYRHYWPSGEIKKMCVYRGINNPGFDPTIDCKYTFLKFERVK